MFFDTTTVASNPGKINISLEKYLETFNLTWKQKLMLRAVAFLPKPWLYKAFRKNNNILHWLMIQEQFLYGCINPAMVVDIEKGLVAVFTDLSNTQGNQVPVVKVDQFYFGTVARSLWKDGCRLATVSVYESSEKDHNANAWVNFEPLLVEGFARNTRDAKTAFNSIKPAAWKCLEEAIVQLPKPFVKGLYHVRLNKKQVHNAY